MSTERTDDKISRALAAGEYIDDFHQQQDEWFQSILAKSESGTENTVPRLRGSVEPIPGRWVRADDWRGVPSVAGVYAICLNGMVVYVGQSRNLRHRIRSYNFRRGQNSPEGFETVITPWGQFKIIRFFDIKVKASVKRGDWAMWEVRLIHRLQPMFNKLLKDT